MVRLVTAAALVAAALATPAAAGPRVCTPASRGPVDAGGCVDVVCLKLCVLQIEVDPHCALHHPAPLPVYSLCSFVDRQFVVIGGG